MIIAGMITAMDRVGLKGVAATSLGRRVVRER
jgi:hypothetical protein